MAEAQIHGADLTVVLTSNENPIRVDSVQTSIMINSAINTLQIDHVSTFIFILESVGGEVQKLQGQAEIEFVGLQGQHFKTSRKQG